MNYSEMTDSEINCEVLAAVEPIVEHMQLSADQKSFFHCGFDGNGFYETPIPDFCNSWGDAGPIIEQHGITLAYDIGGSWVADAAAYWVDGIEWQIDGVIHENPLRAAMIVFLMMKENKDEQ